MLKKYLLAIWIMFSVCLLTSIPSANAEDVWFYTDNVGAQYYYREKIGARAWIGAVVVKVNPNGKFTLLDYQFHYFGSEVPYGISYSNTFDSIEHGYLYGDGIPNPSAKILYEKFLR